MLPFHEGSVLQKLFVVLQGRCSLLSHLFNLFNPCFYISINSWAFVLYFVL